MRFPTVCLIGLAWLLFGSLAPSQNRKDPFAGHVAPTDPRTPADEQKGFRLPPGFEIQLVASEPDIAKPMNLAFDDRGRLWVTESVEYPFPVKDGKARDKVKILEHLGDDGRARKITTFADGLNIPIGVLPAVGSRDAFVFSIPNIYRLRDTKGDGRADQREVFVGSFGFGDTHGMTNAFTWGFDGWIYACHGFSNTSTVQGSDGAKVTMQSGNVYRMKPDGSRVQQFIWGQVNPFGLSFDQLGNLYSADCHTRPVMMLLRGGWYPSFGKPHDGLGFAPEMCSHDHGSTAICGITYYAADHFPPEYRDTLFIGNVITCRINHDKLERHGSTFRAVQQPDFLTSDDPWFRPVDIKLGPDGALYVADFYNRIIGHYEVPLTHPGRDRERGRIWRIVYRGKDGRGKPMAPRADWTKATAAELVQDLGHANLVVRTLATNQLVERGGKEGIEAVRAVHKPESSPWQRVHGLWILERCGSLDDKLLTSAAADKDIAVRVHAQRILSERKELSAAQRELVLAGLKDKDATVQRCAADALGQHPSPEHLRPLLDLRHTVPAADTQLLHTVRMALRNQLRPAEAWAKLPKDNWTERDARSVADVAPGVPSAEAAHYLLEHVRRLPEGRDNLVRFVRHVARYGTNDVEVKLLAFLRQDGSASAEVQAALLRAIEQGTQERGAKLSEAVRGWAQELAQQLLSSGQIKDVNTAIDLAGAFKLESLQKPLAEIAGSRERSDVGQRSAALNALVAIDARRHTALLGRITADAAEPLPLRETGANLLARLNHAEAQAELLKALPTAPARIQNVIATGLAGSPGGAAKLLEAVEAGKASARLLQERAVALRLEKANLPDLKPRLAKLTTGLPPADKRLEELLNRRRTGFVAAKTDLAVGAKVFEKHCAACHQLQGKGMKIGPQLDGIGIRGIERLLEDLLDPNRNIDQAFRQTTLVLKNGQLVDGLLLKEEGEVLVLADAQGKEVRVPKNTVLERNLSLISPMPANLVDQIEEGDFYHLMAYLLKQLPRPDKDK
jgi:putative heme-binding domain-containing protein